MVSLKRNRRQFEGLKMSEWAILIAWAAAFLAIRSHAVLVYLIIPVLAVITFSLLPQFPMILWALFLSVYVDLISVAGVGQGAVQLLIGLIWLAAAVTWLGRQVNAPRFVTPAAIGSAISNDASLRTSIRHDLLTPVKLIQGFCEILLTPSTSASVREPLLTAQQRYIEAIFRNSKQLQLLIDGLFDQPVSTRPAILPRNDTDPKLTPDKARKLLLLLDESGTAIDHFKLHAVEYDLVTASSVKELRRLSAEIHPRAVFVNSVVFQTVPELSAVFGVQTPIITFDLATSQSQLKARGVQHYLAKPVQAEALFAALKSLNIRLRKVLIIDDNVDGVTLMARMFQSLPEPPRLWTAYSGHEALELLRQPIEPDVILMDFVLPDINGLALVDQLRADASWAAVPILMISAHRLEDLLLPSITHATFFCKVGVSLAGLINFSDALE